MRIARRPSPARGGAYGAARVAIVLALLTALGACSTGGGRQAVTPMAVDAGRAASLISAYRAANGLGPVRVDSRLMQAASSYARVMGERDRIDHKIGGTLPRRIGATGYDWGAAAENLAASYGSLGAAMDGWKASAGHRRNLLNPGVTEIGIAAVATPPGAKHSNYWALVLAAPRPQRTAQGGPFAMGAAQ